MKKIPFSSADIQQIASTFKTPFYIYDESAIRENIRQLKKAFLWNEGFKEYFAVKSTPTPAILTIFQQEGCGVECSSLTELLLAERCHFTDHDIMFTSSVTTAEEYQLASKLNAILNLDDTAHLPFLESCAGIPETICFRLNPGIQLTYGDSVLLDYKNSKFGSTKAQLETAYAKLQETGVKHFGIHMQFGCHKLNAEHFGNSVRHLFSFIVALYEKNGIVVDFVNIAGGIGIPYHEDEESADMESISYHIKNAYNDTIGKSSLPAVSLFAELGLSMTGSCGYFVSKVLHIKETYKTFVGLDASTNSFMSPSRYNDYHHITVVGKDPAAQTKCYDITGALCEGRDLFATDRFLPEMATGDLLVFHDAGAYAFSHSNNFNGRLRPAELLLKSDGTADLIRRHETPDDYFSTMVF